MQKLLNLWKFLRYSFREGSRQFWRNRFLSISSILLGSLILFLLNVVFALKFFANYSFQNLAERADFAVVLRENFDSFDFDALRNDLKKFDLELKILDPEVVGETFFVPPRLKLKFNDLRETQSVLEVLKNPRYDTVIGEWDSESESDFSTIVSGILKFRDGVRQISFWSVILFLSGGVLLTFNLFRITIFSRRDEIRIARLAGAEKHFIAGPFFVEGALLGIVASVIAIFVFVVTLREVDFLPAGEIFAYFWNEIFSLELLFSSLTASIGAGLALRKY